MIARLLIVDDNEELLEKLADIVTAAGHEVLTASHPSAAVLLASDHAFDAALIDYKLPEMNGLDLHALLERLRPHANYVLMTGHADPVLQRAVTERRFAALWEKPIPIDQVLELLD